MKKILALCLTAMLLLAMVPVIGASAADVVTLSVGKAQAEIGQTVKIAVSIAGNESTGLSSAKFNIGYNSDVFEIVPYVDEDGNEYEAQDLGHGGIEAQFGPATNNPFVVNWAHGTKKTTKAGDVAIVTFKVKDNAPVGKYPLELTVNASDVFVVVKPDTVPVEFTTVNGEIEVICKHSSKSTIPAVDATCTSTGLTAGEKCDLCGEVVKAQEEVAKLAHTPVVNGDFAADCENPGSTGTTTCSVCGETIKAAEVIDALGHKTEIVGAKDATCEAAGYTGDEVCTVCGKTVKAGEEIAQLSHNWVAVDKKDATCAEEGMEAHYACDAGCGKLAKDEAGAETVTAEELAIAKLAHTIAKVDGVAATEEKAGVKEHYTCTECDTLFADAEGSKVIAADDVVIPVIEKAPENADQGDKAPATNDLVNMFVVVSMLLAAAATVVVLKKKA